MDFPWWRRQKSILLGFIETMDFVDEQHGAGVMLLAVYASLLEGGANILDAGQYRREG